MTLRAVLDDRWRELDRNRPASGLATSPVPVDTPHGPLLVAVDADGGRHLLVPLAARRTLPPDRRSRAVHLLLRPLEDAAAFRHYADLRLMEPALTEVFTSLCEDVLLAVGRDPDRAVRGVRSVLDAWRSLLAGSGVPLAGEALAGLFGELTVLEALAGADPGIAEAWHGPSGGAQDFRHGTHAIEVKSTVQPEGRTVRIHGLGQLAVPAGGTLTLVWFRLHRDGPGGVSVPDLVDRLLQIVDDPGPVRRGLTDLGYHETDRAHYAGTRYSVADSATYFIGPGFPRITVTDLVGDALQAGVDDVEYVVDLDADPARTARCDGYVTRFLGGRA